MYKTPRKKRIPLNENSQTEQPDINSETENQSAENIESAIPNDGKSFAEHTEESESAKEENQWMNAPTGKTVMTSADGTNSEKFDLDKIMSEFGESVPADKQRRTRKPRKPKEPEVARVQMIIPGRLFVTVCDNAMVSAVGAVDAWLSKNPINTDLLKLSDQQITDLSPLAEEAIKAMKLENDPVTVYFGSLAAIYISNYLALKSFMLKQQKDGGN